MTQSSWRVLVVDDQDAVRDSVCDMLQLAGHTVCAAVATGEEALEQVAILQPDVVLMDIQMPGMGGIEAARRIRALRDPVPVVFLTAFGDEKIAEEAAESGGFGYLVKPFHVRQLCPVIQTAIRRFREWQQARSGDTAAEAARDALDRLNAALRTGDIRQAVKDLFVHISAHVGAQGVALAYVDAATHELTLAATWGQSLPIGAGNWVASVALAKHSAQAPAGALGPDSPAVGAAPLNDPSGLVGVLLVCAPAPRYFAGEDIALLEVYARGLGESLANARAQQPMAWRRWLQSSRPKGSQ